MNFHHSQVVKPVNLDALSKWVGHIPEDVIADMAEIAPMLKTMGYDPHGNPPNYGDADKEVIDNTNDIKNHNDDWEKQGEIVKQKSKKLSHGYLHSSFIFTIKRILKIT